MSSYRFILTLCLAVAASFAASAQLKIIPQERLETVASPRLSADSAALSFDTRHIVAEPMNEDDAPRTFRYNVTNISDREINVTSVKTTCSCLAAMSETMILRPGETSGIVVRYNPKGHPGKFERKAFVYTSTGNDPAAVLKLSVDVQTGADLSGEWPVQMGGIRMRRDEITFQHGVKSVEKLRFINLTGSPLRLECEKHFLPACLKFRTEPEVLEAGQTGEMIISYDPSVKADDAMKVILKGLGLPPSKSSINVKMKKD